MCHGWSIPFVSIMDDDKQSRRSEVALFDFNLCTGGLDLFLDLVRLLLCHAFLDCLGGPFHKRLGFRQAESRHRTANLLDHRILFEPISFKITSKVVFSSAAGAAAPPAAAGPAATATGAAALTPHFSSSCLTNPAICSTDRLLSCSTNLSVSAIFISSNCRFRKPSEN